MKKKLGLAAVGLLLSGAAAFAGGAFSQYPIVGVPDNTACQSYGNNGVCNQYNPAGPDGIDGSWVVPTDTGYPNGRNPQTVTTPLALLGFNSRLNLLAGGDFTTNLWQRGTTPVSAATPSTTVMGADRWAVYSSGNTVTVTKQTGASDTIPTLGFYASMRVSRPSGTNTTAICTGQVLDKNAAAPLIGNNAVFSFYGLAGAGLSAVANNQVQVTIAYYTAADSATPGTNTDSFMKGTTTGYTAVTTGSAIASQTATISSGVATVPISTTWTRYGVWGKIPTTNAAGTAVTGVGVTICYTPASGTGGSTEWFEVAGAQLQAQSATVSTQNPNGVTAPSAFERRAPQLEADYQLYYSNVLTDGAATIRYGLGQATTTTNANVYWAFGSPMRITPSITVGTAASFAVTVAAGTAQNCTTLAAVSSAATTNGATLACTVAANLAAGNATQWIGQATGGLLTASSEP